MRTIGSPILTSGKRGESVADVKQLLLSLGNRLMEKHGFGPCSLNSHRRPERGKTTDEIIRFLVWLDATPEAREELENMGYSFVRTVPTVPRKTATAQTHESFMSVPEESNRP